MFSKQTPLKQKILMNANKIFITLLSKKTMTITEKNPAYAGNRDLLVLAN
jgi:hypothetical protein